MPRLHGYGERRHEAFWQTLIGDYWLVVDATYGSANSTCGAIDIKHGIATPFVGDAAGMIEIEFGRVMLG